MNEPVVSASGPVPVAYHQFHVTDPEGSVSPEETDPSDTGLVSISDGQIEISTGIHTGDVEVMAAAYRSEAAPDAGDWQEIVEVSVHSPSGELLVSALMADLDEELPSLAVSGPGNYRLRVHARGRDTAIDLTRDEITEWYLLQCWPAPPSEPLTFRATDSCGTQLRSPQPTDTPILNHEPRGQSARERDILRKF
ncbi:hypothetical protein ACWCP6_28800 [Streptomyces sp. NPDC002004]